MAESAQRASADRDYRPVAALVMAAVGAVLVMLPPELRSTVWRNLFGVPPMPETFGDLRAVTSGWDCLHRGLEFLPVNQCDPWGRPPSLPRLWLVPGLLGLDQSFTDALGLLIATAFVLATLAWVGRSGFPETVVVLLVLLSPAAMLGIERGNVDLVVFCLVATGLAALGTYVDKGRVLAGALGAATLCLAAMLKFYPAFALVPLAVRTRWAIVALIPFGLYMVATASDVGAINAYISVPQWYAYGLVPLCEALGLPQHRTFFVLLTGFLGLAVLVTAVLPGLRNSSRTASPSTLEMGYVTASAIYVGTFLFAATYPYKLVFLILAIPQTLAWIRTRPSRYLGAAVLATMLALMWVPSHAFVPGRGSALMAALSVVLFILLGSTSFLIVLRRLLGLRPGLTVAVASRLRLEKLA
jgi:hypothetical protein